MQAYTAQNVPQIRIFTDNSLPAKVLMRLGMTNAFKAEKHEVYGFSTVNVEALPAVQDSHFIYVVQDNDNVFANQLKEHPVWTGLAFVKEGRTYPLGGNVWLFGGPLSTEIFVDKVVSLLTR